MPRILNNLAVQDQAIAADGVYNYDLAVNPLSVVNIVLRPLNDTGTLANFPSYMAVAQAINRVTIAHRGASVFSMKGEDAAALAYFRHGIMPYQGMHRNVNNERRAVTIPILMGRFPFDPKSCFPASRRGELTLELDLDIADTGYDGLRLSVETVELLDAKPTEYERKVSNNVTFPAVGINDVDLPPGNMVRGIFLYGTTGYTGAVPAPSWGRIKVLVDSEETGYANTDWEVAQMMHCLWGRQPPAYDSHKHIITTDGNAQTELATLGSPYAIGTGFENYAFLDYDPTGDDTFALDVRNKTRFIVQANAETADAVRAIPIEVIPASRAA